MYTTGTVPATSYKIHICKYQILGKNVLSLPQYAGEGWVLMLPFAYLTPLASLAGDKLWWSVLFLTLPLRENGEEDNHNKHSVWLPDHHLLIVTSTAINNPGDSWSPSVPTLDIQCWPVTSAVGLTVSMVDESCSTPAPSHTPHWALTRLSLHLLSDWCQVWKC